ncbi:hypothetical protein J7F01_33745 [Streptomyces sp. ISL-22]|uniref:hypothetical protein n=1 Tax=unclassified Streptomyces TaxID=2593676 RepID=UPI001BE521C1|nr:MULTISPECIES: hypothetical protein [unclassified Streptomyces]MBT2421289.1 hypothetical protein [Streptomyces sp. ISL-24]MBT2437036.1 hypothetical protein [Streptomyces sp. ISL-22]
MADGKEAQKPPVLDQGMCYSGRPETKTDFIEFPLVKLKAMLAGADPDLLMTTSENWGKVHDILAGGKGDSLGIAGALDKAVKEVLEHWRGDAATAFAREAAKISTSIRNAAWHADLNRSQMADASTQLRIAKTEVDGLEEPGALEKGLDNLTEITTTGANANAALAKGDKSASQIAHEYESDIGSSRYVQLKAVGAMETLGANYMRVTRNLRNNKIRESGDGHIKDPNREVEYPPPVVSPGVGASRPSGSASGNKPWSAGRTAGIKPAPSVPRDSGITGGSQLPTAKTKVDSISPGLTGTGPNTGVGVPSGGGGGIGTGGAQGPGVVAPGGGTGVGRGAAGRGGIGVAGGRGGLAGGGAAAGRGAGGRAGMGGMGGAGAGAAGRGGAGASGRGALAKSRGGVVGAAKGVTGKGAGGGAGLHGSRGGTQRGAMAGGMAGGMGGRNGRRSEDENSRGDRPDYLVEDEETWISEEDRNRNVPRTIE